MGTTRGFYAGVCFYHITLSHVGKIKIKNRVGSDNLTFRFLRLERWYFLLLCGIFVAVNIYLTSR